MPLNKTTAAVDGAQGEFTLSDDGNISWTPNGADRPWLSITGTDVTALQPKIRPLSLRVFVYEKSWRFRFFPALTSEADLDLFMNILRRAMEKKAAPKLVCPFSSAESRSSALMAPCWAEERESLDRAFTDSVWHEYWTPAKERLPPKEEPAEERGSHANATQEKKTTLRKKLLQAEQSSTNEPSLDIPATCTATAKKASENEQSREKSLTNKPSLNRSCLSRPHTSKSKRNLLELPQELLDIIFDYAYPQEVDKTYLQKDQWEERECERRRRHESDAIRPFPDPLVCDFFISKKFYENAARSWVGNQIFDDDRENAFYQIMWGISSFDKSIVHQHAKTIRCISYPSDSTYTLPSLKDVTLKISASKFECIEPKFAWETSIDEEDLAEVARQQNLDRYSGLNEFKLIADDTSYATTEEEKTQWKENVAALERFLIPIVKKAKTVESGKVGAEAQEEARVDKVKATPHYVLYPGMKLTEAGLLIPPDMLKFPLVCEAWFEKNGDGLAARLKNGTVREEDWLGVVEQV